METPRTAQALNELARDMLPGALGVEVVETAEGSGRGRLVIEPRHLAPNGYLHAATVVALADTCCGFATMASLPEGAVGFTTIELKTNFLGTALAGELRCEATRVHGGRTTQVWDATVTDADGRVLALFRCTQLLVSPP
jgi:1,4-dihydroxy-2-naphthoyl-CoA hydrolase